MPSVSSLSHSKKPNSHISDTFISSSTTHACALLIQCMSEQSHSSIGGKHSIIKYVHGVSEICISVFVCVCGIITSKPFIVTVTLVSQDCCHLISLLLCMPIIWSKQAVHSFSTIVLSHTHTTFKTMLAVAPPNYNNYRNILFACLKKADLLCFPRLFNSVFKCSHHIRVECSKPKDLGVS